MININKKIILSALVLTIVGAGILGTSRVYAQNTNGGPMSALAQMIADKFNLNKNDVQTVFDQYRSDRQSQTQANFEQKLSQAVTDGKITEAQKQLILSKHKELQDSRDTSRSDIQNMTPEERKTIKETQKQALEDWAKQNNIDLKYFFGGRMGLGHFGGMKGGWDTK